MQFKYSFHILFRRRGPWARSIQHYGLNQSIKNSFRSARGKLRLIFLSTAIVCATFLQRSSICSVKFRWLSNVTPSSFCKVTSGISLLLHAILRALSGIFFSKLLPVTSKTTGEVIQRLLTLITDWFLYIHTSRYISIIGEAKGEFSTFNYYKITIGYTQQLCACPVV